MLGRMLEMFMGCPNGCDDQIERLEAENADLRARLVLADRLAEAARNGTARCLSQAEAAYRASAGEVTGG